MSKAFSEFDETHFKTLLENNSLYFDQQLKKFLKKKNFLIHKIESNDIYNNELNINFRNKSLTNTNLLNLSQKFKLKFYQKFIRKIIMRHRKVFIYQLFYKLLNAKYY